MPWQQRLMHYALRDNDHLSTALAWALVCVLVYFDPKSWGPHIKAVSADYPEQR